MCDPFRWSIGLGKWGSVAVRLHVLFPVLAAATYLLCWQNAGSAAGNLVGWSTVALVLLLLSTMLHEWSHWWVARRFARAPKTLVIGPLGGVSPWPPMTSQPGAIASMLAGPLTNLLMCLICALILGGTRSELRFTELVNPLQPAWPGSDIPAIQQTLYLALWINWLLLLVNLLPAFPFDGGRVLAGILGAWRPNWTAKRVAELVFWIAMGLSAVVIIAGLALLKHQADAIFPSSLALVLLGVVLLVSARRDLERTVGGEVEWQHWGEEDRDNVSEPVQHVHGEPRGDDVLEQMFAAPDDDWLDAGAVERDVAAEQQLRTQEEEREIDAILVRVHAVGVDRLTARERALLDRASERYRSRLGRGD